MKHGEQIKKGGNLHEFGKLKATINENPKYPQLYYNIKGIANPFKNDYVAPWKPQVIN